MSERNIITYCFALINNLVQTRSTQRLSATCLFVSYFPCWKKSSSSPFNELLTFNLGTSPCNTLYSKNTPFEEVYSQLQMQDWYVTKENED